MNAERLREGLASLGLDGTVEARGSLAIVTLADERPLDDETRLAAVALAREHGFSHVALELTGGTDHGAAVHRD
ncbi:MAG TPA: hypothetical protein VFW98_18650 [Gemmatimonadaceae bacterium]|nr:hypothetical protein [Gemmatimonadaceae bacterium]